MGLFRTMAAGVALALYGIASVVEGVALKHAVDAWASAPAAEQAARFASAEAIRWLLVLLLFRDTDIPDLHKLFLLSHVSRQQPDLLRF